MKPKHFLKSYKILHAFAFIILIQIFITGFQYLFSNDKNAYKNTKTIYELIIEKCFTLNYQSGDDLPINNENFELEKNLDDYHKPLGHNFIFNNYQIKPKHYSNLHPFYIVAFHPEIIPPPPKTEMQNS
jgi:hypothetical protein